VTSTRQLPGALQHSMNEEVPLALIVMYRQSISTVAAHFGKNWRSTLNNSFIHLHSFEPVSRKRDAAPTLLFVAFKKNIFRQQRPMNEPISFPNCFIPFLPTRINTGYQLDIMSDENESSDTEDSIFQAMQPLPPFEDGRNREIYLVGR
jgi:hypothetical protein